MLRVFPRTQELVVQGPHTHADAVGAATMFDHLLRLLVDPSPTEPPWGDEGKNLTSPLTITARIPKYTAEQKLAWDKNLSHFMSQFPTVRVHNENTGVRATTTKLQWLKFNREETVAIVTKSKQLGFTVTAAAISHAARPGRQHHPRHPCDIQRAQLYRSAGVAACKTCGTSPIRHAGCVPFPRDSAAGEQNLG